ncbi:hypothetical protein [Bacillus toyonensis]|uniref:hypothetical protein n=1 Tax=Bacillus toyonensis TaxID=155322 RepID=UPI000BF836A4|nr:hypothetical protein [Bacillus toyonensis]KAB2384442.1 hypothetical protein F8507_16230 [Bacillus toyonensis]PFX65975.1 hypothetical protein COL35_17420 [Bacillus toyonensis]
MSQANFNLGINDITVDSNGRVVVNNPEIERAIREHANERSAPGTRPPTNGNCNCRVPLEDLSRIPMPGQ